MTTYLAVYLGAVAISLPATVAAIRLARFIGAMDAPGLRKVHKGLVPRIGGVAIVAATIGSVLLVLLLDNVVGGRFRQNLPQVIALLSMGVLMFAVGLVDDIRGLCVRHKLLAQFATAAGLCAMGVRIDVLEVHGLFRVEFGYVSWPLTMLWIVGVTNAINLIDGLDGLAAGISAVACAVIAVFAVYTNLPIMAVLMLAMLGGLTGFLVFNFHPAKIFLGDCGSLFLGFVLAGASVLGSMKAATAVGLALPILAMGIPIFDTIFTILRRAIERRPIFSADRGHIHHKLLSMGLHQRHAVLMLYGATLLAAGMGMFMMFTRDSGTLAVFSGVVFLLLLMFRATKLVHMRGTLAAFQRNLTVSRQARKIRQDLEKAQLQLQEATTFRAWWREICGSADKMGMGRLAIIDCRPDGTTRTVLSHHSGNPLGPCDVIHIVVSVPGRPAESSLRVQMDIPADNSLEVAGHRLTLFARLIEANMFHARRPGERSLTVPGSAPGESPKQAA